MVRDWTSSLSDVLTRCFGDDEALKIAVAANLGYYADDPDRLWWVFFAVAQGGYLADGGYYLEGGSGTLTGALVDIVREEGGAAEAGCTVLDVRLDETGAVNGVDYRIGEGQIRKVEAPVVFANAAPHVVAPLLPEAVRDRFLAPYAHRRPSISVFSLTLGLTVPPASLGVSAWSTVLVPDWVEALTDYRASADLFAAPPGERLPVLSVVDYGAAASGLDGPDDLATLAVVGADRLSNWDGLDEAAYRARRDGWADAMISRLDQEWPGLKNAVAAREMVTARSMHAYLGTPDGAVYGFAPDVPGGSLLAGPPGSPKTAVEGLWLASAFGGFGGFTGVMGVGAAAARSALRRASGRMRQT